MQIRVKLMGLLRDRAPEGNVLELPDGATVDDALAALDIAADHVHLVMLDGKHTKNRSTELADGVEMMVMPPVGGG